MMLMYDLFVGETFTANGTEVLLFLSDLLLDLRESAYCQLLFTSRPVFLQIGVVIRCKPLNPNVSLDRRP